MRGNAIRDMRARRHGGGAGNVTTRLEVKNGAPPAALHLGLIGRGIEHSPSPALHEAALKARGLRGDYALFDVPPTKLPDLLQKMRSGELSGCNVTVPYKEALAAACDRLDGDAAVCRAVNIITLSADELVGDNTDARGFGLALSYLRLSPEPGGRGLVLGAGGAASAVVLALCRMGLAQIVVAARRVERAADLCRRVSPETARPVSWDARSEVQRLASASDIVVNATPVGAAQVPVDIRALRDGCVVADLRYRPRPTDLVAAAAERGLRATDGAEMLLFQGMLSFQRWTGTDPPWPAARQALAAALGREAAMLHPDGG
jgi:shikimate dehydrogenase